MGDTLVKCCFYENKNVNELKKGSIILFNKSDSSNNNTLKPLSDNDIIQIFSKIHNFNDLKPIINSINNSGGSSDFEFKYNKKFFFISEFSYYLFEKINEIRTNPESFINIISESKKNIIKTNENFYYKYNDTQILLRKGEKSFNDAIEYLRNLKNMDKLELDINLFIPLPTDKKKLKDKHYLNNMVVNKIRNGIRIKCFWSCDINIKEICLLKMILDENNENKEKRNSLLNKNMKKIGISCFEIDKYNVCYILLSDK